LLYRLENDQVHKTSVSKQLSFIFIKHQMLWYLLVKNTSPSLMYLFHFIHLCFMNCLYIL